MKKILTIFITLFFTSHVFGANHVVDLVVAYKTVDFAGKARTAIAVNDQIPAPTLHFKEGDHVTINVHNQLDEETAIHWHGMILPWQMDGVLGITQHGIPPGGVFQYQFTLHQSGTYWYHAHAGLQEQQGLYGALLIDPLQPENYQYTKDYTVVLSDWSNTNPNKILANLKKEGDYYAPKFPLQASLQKFIHDYRKASVEERKNLLSDYKMMQQMRMSIYDFSDVAYDAFLINGHSTAKPWTAPVEVGDAARLRFIGAAGSTIFRVKIPGTTMQIVHIDGNDIEPYEVEDFTLAPGETYDALVKISQDAPYIIYAESLDTAASAYAALVTSSEQTVNYQQAAAFPQPLPVTTTMMTMMMGKMQQGMLPAEQKHAHGSLHHCMHKEHMPMDHSMHQHHSMDMPMEATIIGDKILTPTSAYRTSSDTKYKNLTAAVPTNDPIKPIAGVINMELFGYMDHYIWFINGLPENKAAPIVLEPGKRYRFVFTNISMMHHPMHMHGHWFILREGKGAYDPLLHTIDIAPGATITADVDMDASGQWMFHCHLLYHMLGGMARTFQYSTLIEIVNNHVKPENIIEQTPYHNRPIVRVDNVESIDTSLVHHPMAHEERPWFAAFLDIATSSSIDRQKLSLKGMYGADYNKLELFIKDAEVHHGKVENADMDIFYWHLLNQFWAIKGGINYFYRPAETTYWQPGIGIEGTMPYFIETDIRGYFYNGSAKLDIELSRDTQITNNFFIGASIRSVLASKTVKEAEIGNGLNLMRYALKPYYRLMPGLDVFAEFEREQAYGTYKDMQRHVGESSTQNTLMFGISMLF